MANPSDASINGKLAMLLQAHRSLAAAETVYRRAHALDPQSAAWSYYLAYIESELGNCAQASEAFRETLTIDSTNLSASLGLAECFLASGEWQSAMELYRSIVKSSPDNASAYFGLGRVLAIRGDLNGAAEALIRALHLFPTFGAAHYALAHVYKRLGREQLSINELNVYQATRNSGPPMNDELEEEVRALSTDPQDQSALAADLASAGNLSAAAAAEERALRLDPKLVNPHVDLISLYGRLAEFAKAEDHFRSALALNPHNAAAYFNHAVLMAGQHRFAEAAEDFSQALEISPHYPDARLSLGSMLEAQNKSSEAIDAYQKALEDSPNDARAHFALGRVLVNAEDYPAGIQHLLQSVRAADENSRPTYLYALGASYARAGDRDSALRYLRQARQEAVVHSQSKLVENLDRDLQQLETASPVPR